MLLFVLALLCKTVASTMPATILVLIVWRRGRVAAGECLALVPLFALGAVAGFTTAWVESHLIGAAGARFGLSFADRLLLAGRAVPFYVGKLLWPEPLIFIYRHWSLRPAVGWQWAYPVATAGVAATLWLGRRWWGRTPAAAMAAYVIALVPALGVAKVYPFQFSYVADHFQYLATPVLFAVVGSAVATADRRSKPAARRVLRVVVIAALISLGVITWERQAAYADVRTLWLDTARLNPEAWIAQSNLGTLAFESGQLSAARDYFTAAIALDPDAPSLQFNLGCALLAMNQPRSAVAPLAIAVRQRPGDAVAHHLYGNALFKAGDEAAGIQELRSAMSLSGSDAAMTADLAYALATARRSADRDPALASQLATRADVLSLGYSVRAAEAGAEAALALGDRARAAAEFALAGRRAAAAGDAGRASDLADRSAAAARRLGSPGPATRD